MSYTDLRDFVPEYIHESPLGVTVQVEKLGGGTLGREYTGTWRYIVTDAATGDEIARGQDFSTGMPHTHRYAARELAEYFAPVTS